MTKSELIEQQVEEAVSKIPYGDFLLNLYGINILAQIGGMLRIALENGAAGAGSQENGGKKDGILVLAEHNGTDDIPSAELEVIIPALRLAVSKAITYTIGETVHVRLDGYSYP